MTSGIGADYARTMGAYNQWMNNKLYALCAALSDAERKQDRGAYFKSIDGTLNHLLLGDRVWLGRFLQRPFMVSSLAQILYSDFAELRHQREQTDAEILAWAQDISDARLAEDLSYTSIVASQTRTQPLGFLVMHFFNHQTHHRGQLTTLLSQCGVAPDVTDLLWLASA
jgi:uncharacterized damage-inducible protein DinB